MSRSSMLGAPPSRDILIGAEGLGAEGPGDEGLGAEGLNWIAHRNPQDTAVRRNTHGNESYCGAVGLTGRVGSGCGRRAHSAVNRPRLSLMLNPSGGRRPDRSALATRL
jgi:hypothetical protein